MNRGWRFPTAFLSTAALAAAGVPAATSVPGAATAVDTVFVVPGSHLDLGFTSPLSEVRERRIRILDLALENAERDSSFVWFEEGGWSVEQWLDHYAHDAQRIGRLRRLVLSGRVGVGATLLSPHAAAFPEALSLLTLHLDRVERELGRRPLVAVLNDVPSAPEALVDALAAAGVRYLLIGANMTFTVPLPASLVRRPFHWESAHGSRVLVFVDPDGFTTGFDRWGLPPECARFFNRERFPANLSDEAVLTLGVGAGLARLPPDQSLSLIQDALDNWEPGCAAELPAAVRRWNARGEGARLVLATPEPYFGRIEARNGARLPVLRGEWGGDWDVIRASEPVWTWRLREAFRAPAHAAARDARLSLTAALDHNVGLGPRWMDGLAESAALEHVRDVAALYRIAVEAALGPEGLAALPPPLARPQLQPWPAAWDTLVGPRGRAACVRVGPGFPHPFVDDSVSVAPVPVETLADGRRLLVRTRLDRGFLRQLAGPRHRAVLEVGLHVPRESLKLAPEGSPSAAAGRWLCGSPPQWVVAPAGVRITGPGLAIRAQGPLLLTWRLVPDPAKPGVTRLQALAIMEAMDGVVREGRRTWPFTTLYPGEPEVVDFELELERLSP